MLKKIIYSMCIGCSIGTGPYALATQLPTSAIKKANGEGAGFGERCLFDEDICALMKEEKFEQDSEEMPSDDTGEQGGGGGGGSGGKTIEGPFKQRVNKEWKKLLQKQDNDYCGFGFLGYETDPATGKKTQTETNVNNLEACWKSLFENKEEKKKQKKK